MIDYSDSYFNVTTIFRVYGSSTYKACGYAILSSAIYAVTYYYAQPNDGVFGFKEHQLLVHPYPVTVICTAFMFVLSAKVTFCYNRFWEACTALHNMHSKWLDVGSTLAAFHMQSEAYEKIQPPSFGDYQDLNDLVLQHSSDLTATQTEKPQSSDSVTNDTHKPDSEAGVPTFASYLTKKTKNSPRAKGGGVEMVSIATQSSEQLPYPEFQARSSLRHRNSFANNNSRVGVNAVLSTDTIMTPSSELISTGTASFTSVGERRTQVPSLFLQEAAHLVSLVSAVALSTLRCDSEGAEAPLSEFVPGRRWPDFDSNDDPDTTRYGHRKNRFVTTMKYMMDASRTRKERAAHNAARPFPVIGGLSEREAYLLQKARGSCAKTALAFMWLNEFIIREQQHGSLGSVAPPIVSRLQQYSSDGHLWYNAARKMSYIPFPFPHAQMAALFVIASTVLMPALMLSKTAASFGFVLNFLTVLLFAGLNEISKELEFPFRGMPNDLPLNLFQAQFNEALVTMFSGFHPDSWWEVEGVA
mmetsp:Transcript_6376/g.15879  ORF Transcript_6376/g.15879 Transcript_6376/m.15879 type:complete len:528 (+) Transcript_6376:94-1677(+)